MSTQGKEQAELDWELTDEFYSQDAGKKELSLEDFMDDTSADLNADSGLDASAEASARLEQVAADVSRVLALSSQGKMAADIAAEMGVETSYVSDIMVCIQAFPEDNPLAVARLIVMG